MKIQPLDHKIITEGFKKPITVVTPEFPLYDHGKVV